VELHPIAAVEAPRHSRCSHVPTDSPYIRWSRKEADERLCDSLTGRWRRTLRPMSPTAVLTVAVSALSIVALYLLVSVVGDLLRQVAASLAAVS
jgi:hypothetical protein